MDLGVGVIAESLLCVCIYVALPNSRRRSRYRGAIGTVRRGTWSEDEVVGIIMAQLFCSDGDEYAAREDVFPEDLRDRTDSRCTVSAPPAHRACRVKPIDNLYMIYVTTTKTT